LVALVFRVSVFPSRVTDGGSWAFSAANERPGHTAVAMARSAGTGRIILVMLSSSGRVCRARGLARADLRDGLVHVSADGIPLAGLHQRRDGAAGRGA